MQRLKTSFRVRGERHPHTMRIQPATLSALDFIEGVYVLFAFEGVGVVGGVRRVVAG